MALKKYIGFEIETVFNSQLVEHFLIGSYHNGIRYKKTYWCAELDNSISTYLNQESWKPWSKKAEFVSDKLDSPKKIKKALKEFKDLFSCHGKYELNQVLNFNTSQGLHFHVSFNKDRKEYKFIDFLDNKVYLTMRKRLFKGLKNSNIGSKKEIKKHYFRHYALKSEFDREGNPIETVDKYQELNFSSEYCKKGFEWRSPNLLNIKTWAEFDFLMNLYLKSINFMVKKLIKNKTNDITIIDFEETEKKPIEEKIELNNFPTKDYERLLELNRANNQNVQH